MKKITAKNPNFNHFKPLAASGSSTRERTDQAAEVDDRSEKRAAPDSLVRSPAKKQKEFNESAGRLAASIAPDKVGSRDAQEVFVRSLLKNDLYGVRGAIEAGADVNMQVSKHAGYAVNVVARYAPMLPVMKELIAAGANVNLGNEIGGALWVAVHARNIDAIELLLSSGADPFAEGLYDSPFVTAMGMRNQENDGEKIYQLFLPYDDLFNGEKD